MTHAKGRQRLFNPNAYYDTFRKNKNQHTTHFKAVNEIRKRRIQAEWQPHGTLMWLENITPHSVNFGTLKQQLHYN